MKTEAVLADLTQFQHALADHVGWLQRWYQAILHHGSIPDPSSESCPFAAWHRRNTEGRIAEYADFENAGMAHEFVHAMATQITERALAGHTVTTSDFEALMSAALAFGVAAQALEREVWRTLATFDPLTGLANRHIMRSQLLRERDRAIRHQKPLCLALADIDNFKAINDGFGHQFGDAVIREVADALTGAVRPYDIVYRYGGEEFLFCLPGADLETAVQVLQRVREAVAALVVTDKSGTWTKITCTFGVARLDANISVEDSIKNADRALYDGKRAGRNCVVSHAAG